MPSSKSAVILLPNYGSRSVPSVPPAVSLVKFIILVVLLCTYWHLLCSLSLALAGLVSQFLASGLSIFICIIHPINTATVHAKDVGTRQKNIQVNNQNSFCLAPAMSQASSILRAAKQFARVNVASLLAFSASVLLVCEFAVGISKQHSLGLCIHQALWCVQLLKVLPPTCLNWASSTLG